MPVFASIRCSLTSLRDIAAIALMLLSMFASCTPSAAATDIMVLKGVYLYNFIRFTEWPQETGQMNDVQVAVFDSSHFADLLREISSKSKQFPKMTVDDCPTLDCRPDVQAVFIHFDEAIKRKYILDQIADKSVLSISDQQGFLEQGGMIELYELDGRLVFDINLPALKKAGLYLSADIINMARNIIREPKHP